MEILFYIFCFMLSAVAPIFLLVLAGMGIGACVLGSIVIGSLVARYAGFWGSEIMSGPEKSVMAGTKISGFGFGENFCEDNGGVRAGDCGMAVWGLGVPEHGSLLIYVGHVYRRLCAGLASCARMMLSRGQICLSFWGGHKHRWPIRS